MAERNPNIPHERRKEMEERERYNEEEANRRFAEKQAKLAGQSRGHEGPNPPDEGNASPATQQTDDSTQTTYENPGV